MHEHSISTRFGKFDNAPGSKCILRQSQIQWRIKNHIGRAIYHNIDFTDQPRICLRVHAEVVSCQIARHCNDFFAHHSVKTIPQFCTQLRKSTRLQYLPLQPVFGTNGLAPSPPLGTHHEINAPNIWRMTKDFSHQSLGQKTSCTRNKKNLVVQKWNNNTHKKTPASKKIKTQQH